MNDRRLEVGDRVREVRPRPGRVFLGRIGTVVPNIHRNRIHVKWDRGFGDGYCEADDLAPLDAAGSALDRAQAVDYLLSLGAATDALSHMTGVGTACALECAVSALLDLGCSADEVAVALSHVPSRLAPDEGEAPCEIGSGNEEGNAPRTGHALAEGWR